jgi:hypothetical protein
VAGPVARKCLQFSLPVPAMQYFADDEDFDEQARQQTAELRREIARRLDDIRGNNTMRKPASAAQAIDAMCQRQ